MAPASSPQRPASVLSPTPYSPTLPRIQNEEALDMSEVEALLIESSPATSPPDPPRLGTVALLPEPEAMHNQDG